MSRTLDLGGSERQVAEVAMSLDRTLFEPSVACFDGRGARADDLRRAGVPVVEFPVRSFASPAALNLAWQFVRWLRRHRVALVHPFDVPTIAFGVPLARLARVRVVLSSQRGDRRLYEPSYQRIQGVTDRLADAIVVNSDYLRRVLRTEFGVADDRMHTCHNGVDTTRFHSEGRVHRPELAGSLVVGIVAALRSEKSIETLIDAFRLVRAPGRVLAIVGDGPCRASLQQRAHDAGLDDCCVFATAAGDVASWYRSLDVFVLPSTNESFSNSLMEAMACGCAVVASRVGGNPELVIDGENGLLFEAEQSADLARQLDRLLGDAALRTRLAAAAVQTIHAGYTRERSARRFADFYLERLESGSRPLR